MLLVGISQISYPKLNWICDLTKPISWAIEKVQLYVVLIHIANCIACHKLYITILQILRSFDTQIT